MADFPIHMGYWRDYAADPINQQVLTLPIRWGGFLISALALLVSTAGGSFWTIIAYILHQRRAPHATDITPAQLQLQVSLRNSRTPLATAVDSFFILRAWPRAASPAVRWQALGVASAALLSLGAFTVAGVFVAAIASSSEADTIALAQQGTCGLWGLDLYTQDLSAYEYLIRFSTNTTLRSRAYARAWYADTPSNTAPQSYFPLRTLPYTTSFVPCPFPGEHRCLSNDSSNTAMVLDTGRLNTHRHLGMNAPAAQTMDVRWVATCSPVNTLDMRVRRNQSGVEYCSVNAGSAGGLTGFPDGPLNFPCRTSQDMITYTSRSLTYQPVIAPNNQFWVPNSVFMRDDAEVSIHAILQNGVQYMEPVYDPLFSANGTRSISLGLTDLKIFQPDYFVNTMVCLNQVQFCNPNNDNCTALTHAVNATNQTDWLHLNEHQNLQVTRLGFPVILASTFWAGIGPLSTAGLLATESIFLELFSAGLPPDQWKQEVSLWFQTGLARVQELIMAYGRLEMLDIPNPHIDYTPVDDPNWNVTASQRDAAKYQCANMKIRSRGQVQNFNLVGLIIIVVVSIVLIVIALILEPCMKRWRKLRQSHVVGRARQHARDMDNMFYVLRAALQGVGIEPWRRGGKKEDMDIPVVDRPVLLERHVVAGVVSNRFYEPFHENRFYEPVDENMVHAEPKETINSPFQAQEPAFAPTNAPFQVHQPSWDY